MQGLLSDRDSKEGLVSLREAYKAYTVNGQIIARIAGTHVILGQIKDGKVYLNDQARDLLESIPKLSVPMVPVGVVHITKPIEAEVVEVPKAPTPRKPRAPRKPKVQDAPEETFDLSSLDDFK